MLSTKEKIAILEELLVKQENSYSDSIREELYVELIENQKVYYFLKDFSTQQEIQDILNTLIHRVIMHEHEEDIKDIVDWFVFR
ncbi:hypothetical protein QM480_01270 [Flectobacillus sp. DC10W]|uniref:Uncharacterized protein n=1 Tax=Flectobacillus longus TaxID=2984207 RepID=A0ABT6YH66_9BACT|nr:hypothetical protein [Flectobacillus longus]MDI9862937.1 hypothetical protein [Flectobacillus longus]